MCVCVRVCVCVSVYNIYIYICNCRICHAASAANAERIISRYVFDEPEVEAALDTKGREGGSGGGGAGGAGGAGERGKREVGTRKELREQQRDRDRCS